MESDHETLPHRPRATPTSDATIGMRRHVGDALGSVAHAAEGLAGAAVALPGVGPAWSLVHDLIGQLPSFADELDVVLHELRAKRLTVQAVQQELAVLDEQLGVLEAALAPMERLTQEWRRLT